MRKQYKLRRFEFTGNNGYKVTISVHCSSSDMEGCGNKVRGRLQADPSTSNKNPISNDTSYSDHSDACIYTPIFNCIELITQRKKIKMYNSPHNVHCEQLKTNWCKIKRIAHCSRLYKQWALLNYTKFTVTRLHFSEKSTSIENT